MVILTNFVKVLISNFCIFIIFIFYEFLVTIFLNLNLCLSIKTDSKQKYFNNQYIRRHFKRIFSLKVYLYKKIKATQIVPTNGFECETF